MTTRRRLLVIGLPFALMVLLGLWLLWPRSSTITRENASKIQVGMTLAEVEALLGGPPRDELTGRVQSDEFADEPDKNQRMRIWDEADIEAHKRDPAARYLQWRSDHVFVRVHTDPAGRVFGYHVLPLRRESLLEQLRRVLGL
jgi:hypothetical protein